MDARTKKLQLRGLDNDLAPALVVAGLDTPAKIKAASDKDLRAVPGVGAAALAKIRAQFPKG